MTFSSNGVHKTNNTNGNLDIPYHILKEQEKKILENQRAINETAQQVEICKELFQQSKERLNVYQQELENCREVTKVIEREMASQEISKRELYLKIAALSTILLILGAIIIGGGVALHKYYPLS